MVVNIGVESDSDGDKPKDKKTKDKTKKNIFTNRVDDITDKDSI